MLPRHPVLSCAIVALAITGCAPAQHPATRWPPPRPLGADLAAFKAPQTPADAPIPADPQGNLTLPQALAAALMHNPKLASASYQVRIEEARTLQAGLLPNPELEIEVEDFAGIKSGKGRGGPGPRAGFKRAHTTLQLSQLIELGGKRAARIRLSQRTGALAAWDYETQRVAIFVETTLAFVDVLTAQRQLLLAEEIHTLAAQVYDTVAARVKAGKVSPLEEIKATIERANAKITLENATRNLTAVRNRLALTWAGSAARFDTAVGEMDAVAALPDFERVEQFMTQNPAVARWAMEMQHRLAALALERARRVPDLTLTAGVQRFEEDDDTAFLVGLSMPLPFFDRNQGNILGARYRIAKAAHDRKAAELRTSAAITESYALLAAAQSEAVILKNELLPASQQAFDAARHGYRQGKFAYLDVLDAQRTFFETRARYTQVLASYHRGVAVLESLIGTALAPSGLVASATSNPPFVVPPPQSEGSTK